MRVFATSDFHGGLAGLEPGGFGLCEIGVDFSPRRMGITPEGEAAWMQRENIPWMTARKAEQFVVVPGSHAVLKGRSGRMATGGREFFGWPESYRILIDEGFDFWGMRVCGCPWIGPFGGRWANEESSDVRLEARHVKIPGGHGMLVWHNSPRREWSGEDAEMNARRRCYEPSGSMALAKAIERAMPRAVFWGHVRDGLPGDVWVDWANGGGRRTYVYNVSRLDSKYRVRYEPRAIEVLTKRQMKERDNGEAT